MDTLSKVISVFSFEVDAVPEHVGNTTECAQTNKQTTTRKKTPTQLLDSGILKHVI